MEQLGNSDYRRVVLITGASVGLGLAIAKNLITDDRFFVVLTARGASSLRFHEAGIFATERIWLRNIDIEDSNQINIVITEIEERLGGVDIIINNAGIAERATVEDSSKSYRQHQLNINYLAPFEMISRVLPRMREKREGQIINVSSVAGFMAMPTMSAYSASKAALEAATESLWYEMKPWGIHVSLVIPGFINSLGHLNTSSTIEGRVSAADVEGAYYEHYRGMSAFILKAMQVSFATNESISRQIFKLIQMKNPPLRVNVTADASLLFWFRKLLPPRLYHFVLYKLLPNISSWGLSDFKTRTKLI